MQEERTNEGQSNFSYVTICTLLQAQEVEEEEERRQAIRQEKRQKEESIKQKIETIKKVRQSASQQNRQSREERLRQKQEQEDEKEKEYYNSCLTLAEKLARKREQREAEQKALEEESEQIRRKNLFLGAAKQQLEEKHFDDYIQAQERDLRKRQEQEKLEQKKQEAIQAKERLRKLRYSQMQTKERVNKDKERREQVQQASQEAEEFTLSQRDIKKRQFFAQSAREERLHATEELADPFTASVRSLRQDEARERWHGPPRQEQHLETLRQRFNRMNQDQAEVCCLFQASLIVSSSCCYIVVIMQATGLVDTVQCSTKAKQATIRRLRAMDEKDVSGVLGKSGAESLQRTRDQLAMSMRTTQDLGTTYSPKRGKH